MSVYFVGFPYLISKYAEDFGLVDEECFPYEGKEVQCKEKRCSRQFGTGYHYIGGFYGGCNEELIRIELVKNGPIAVSFEVYDDFRYLIKEEYTIIQVRNFSICHQQVN